MAKKKKKSKLGAKALIARILVIALVTAIGGIVSFLDLKHISQANLRKIRKLRSQNS